MQAVAPVVADEMKVVEELCALLERPGVGLRIREERDLIVVLLEGGRYKLRTLVFSRRALRRLLGDSARDVKIDYLRRDIARALDDRAEFRYPRIVRRPSLRCV